MATPSVLLPSAVALSMAGRRAPLASVPNAINSPFRNVNNGSGKRSRVQIGEQHEHINGQPPLKKQVVELRGDNVENVEPRRRDGVPAVGVDKLNDAFIKRKPVSQPSEFHQRLLAAREKRNVLPQQEQKPQEQQHHLAHADHTQKAVDDNLASIRQWQRHYRRQFPTFVFYFESVPEGTRSRFVAQCKSLGAKEAKFFSKDVTHVITTRQIPAEVPNAISGTDGNGDTQPKISRVANTAQEHKRTTDLLEANLQRRAQGHAAAAQHGIDPRKVQSQSADILLRAREMNIKIWASEKLQRVLSTILETDAGDSAPSAEVSVRTVSGRTITRPNKDADLEQLLRNEKVNGPADRDMSVAGQDMIPLKGYYIYIHDMDERTKPVMVRDYEKPASKEQGKWPQFRLTSAGRCPFIEDPTVIRQHLKQQEQEAQAAKAEEELAAQRKTRSAATANQMRPLVQCTANLRRSPRKIVQQTKTEMAKPLEPPKTIPVKRQSSIDGVPQFFGSTQQGLRGLPRMIGGEPVASGLQQSNITSAIRSQVVSSAVISSTTAGIPKRVGDTKEVSALKRKVLERSATNATSNQSMPSSYMNDVRAAINNHQDPPPRAAKRRAQETLGVVHEDDENGQSNARVLPRGKGQKTGKPIQRELKPGYCENCRDKFVDFDEHVNSRKHRKFAMTLENWKELDELLSQLKRPHKIA